MPTQSAKPQQPYDRDAHGPGGEGRYLTASEAARYLSVSENALAKLRVTGGGPAFTKIGRRIRYGTHALHTWLRAHEYAATQPRS